ncbi:ribosomal RNA-processing protein 7 homolog A isoform X2 [Condylostylus longicornis]|nr:ribosomal RNA-processing protein 7 homolog A isoform X2 [Condylostylus longicornis]
MKEHYIRVIDEEKPRGKTLFLLNIPPYIHKQHLKSFFEKKAGEVVSVILSEKPGKDEEGTAKFKISEDVFLGRKSPFVFKCAYIVFKLSKSIQQALQITEISFCDTELKSVFKSGVEKWADEYIESIIPEDELQTEIDSFMREYDAKDAKAIEAEKAQEADNDGWITVGKHGKNVGFEQKESIINKIEDKMQKNKKNRELKNFYTFQIRESKMKNIVSLRKKFEEDKKKIEALKKSRRFKPF